MKRILFLLIFLCTMAAQQVNGQILITLLLGDKLNSEGLEFGLVGGGNWATVSGMESNSYVRTWNLGFYFDIRMKEPWYLYTGVLVKSRLGVNDVTTNDLLFLEADTYPAEGTYSQQISYFLVPALFRYKFKNHMYVEAGPQFGLAYKGWVEYRSDIDGKQAAIRDDNLDKLNRIDAGLSAGLGYTMLKGNGWTVGVRYYYGFVNVYKDRANTKNSSFFAELHIPIGVASKKEN
jgi:hypothetical protein